MKDTEMIIERATEMVKERRAITMGNIASDKERYTDAFLSQFMHGRVAVEQNDLEWLDKLLAVLE
jgi:hypothetical protein